MAILDGIPYFRDINAQSDPAKAVKFKPLFLAALQAAHPADPYGYVGAFVSNADFATFQNLAAGVEAEVYERYPEPIELGPAATAVDIYKHRITKEMSDKERDELRMFQHTLHMRQPPNIQQAFINEVGRLHLGETTVQWAKLEIEWGKLTSEHIDLEDAKLAVPYRTDAPLSEYFLVHDVGHRFRIQVKVPFTEYEKFQLAMKGLIPCGVFATTIRTFFTTHSDISAQTYAAFKAFLLQEGPRDLKATKSMLSTASAITANTASMAQQIAELKEANKRLESKFTQMMETKSAPTSTKPSNHYCYTCGSQPRHPSHRCTNPGPGHDNSATKHDKKGSTRT